MKANIKNTNKVFKLQVLQPSYIYSRKKENPKEILVGKSILNVLERFLENFVKLKYLVENDSLSFTIEEPSKVQNRYYYRINIFYTYSDGATQDDIWEFLIEDLNRN